jgi:hypothetical protein
MEYRGKQYAAVQSLDGKTWKWSVALDGRTKSGKAMSRAVASSWLKPKLIGRSRRKDVWCHQREVHTALVKTRAQPTW